MQRLDVCIAHRRLLFEAASNPVFDGPEFTVEHPEQHAERIEILAATTLGLAQAEFLDGLEIEMANIRRDYLEIVERAVLAGIAVIARLRQVTCRKGIVVDNDKSAPVEQRQADLEGSRIERHEDLRRVAGCRDRSAAEINLVGGYAEGRPHGRPDLGREVREGRKIGAGQRRRGRELRPHELDAIARVTRKTDDDRVYVFVFTHRN